MENQKPKTLGELLPQKNHIPKSIYKRKKLIAERVYALFEKNFKNLIEESGAKFILEENNREALGQVCLWYCMDSRYKKSLQKGLLIRGVCGTGKTKICETLGRVMAHVEEKSLKIVSAYDLQRLYERQLDVEIDLLKKRALLVIDDVGVESVETRYYGNTSEPFKDLMYARYQAGNSTIITTNLTPTELKLRYGDRIYDRMREMLNDLIVHGNSYRK